MHYEKYFLLEPNSQLIRRGEDEKEFSVLALANYAKDFKEFKKMHPNFRIWVAYTASAPDMYGEFRRETYTVDLPTTCFDHRDYVTHWNFTQIKNVHPLYAVEVDLRLQFKLMDDELYVKCGVYGSLRTSRTRKQTYGMSFGGLRFLNDE